MQKAAFNAAEIADTTEVMREKISWCADLFQVIAELSEQHKDINNHRISRLSNLGNYLAGLAFSGASDLDRMAEAANIASAAIRKSKAEK